MVDERALESAAVALRKARLVTVFTGAGASAESGIDTFRDPGGLWEQYPPDQFATWQGLLRTAVVDPKKLTGFLRDVLEPLAMAEPNAGHRAIVALERYVQTTVVTQNIDGLHREAGSSYVHEVHGSIFEVTTLDGQPLRRLRRADLRRICDALERASSTRVPLLHSLRYLHPLVGLSLRHGPYRPSVVLFGEALRQPAWEYAQRDARQCDVMLVIGTSALVMPAAELPLWARRHGAKVIVVDPGSGFPADIHLRGRAAEILPRLVEVGFGT